MFRSSEAGRSASQWPDQFFSRLALLGIAAYGALIPFAAVADVQSERFRAVISLCEWQQDYSFFTSAAGRKQVDTPSCDQAFLARTAPDLLRDQAGVVMSAEPSPFESELRKIVADYPIEAMLPYIAEYDQDIAGLIVGIAKKESNWGKRSPRTDDGDDCFNYWGYKGAGTRGMAMGHGCFGDAAEAVRVIGSRLQALVEKKRSSEPAQLTIWKCGSSCVGHSPESVRKWISDVELYYRAIARR